VTESDRGSVLLLFPAAFMIVLVLGSLAIDSGAVFLQQRELAIAAGAAANDAVTLGLDPDLLRDDGEARLDPDRVRQVVDQTLARRGVLAELIEPPQVVIVDDSRVEVTLVAHASYVIAPALPGRTDGRTVRATVGANAVLDD
jgi:Flp pilus assembly protein TadG